MIRLRNFFTALFFIAIILSSGAALHAQGTGTVTGKVIDAVSGEPMIGVSVFIREQKKFVATNINGQYYLTGIPAGQHTVTFQMMGYATSQTTVNVVPGGRAVINTSLGYSTGREVVVEAKKLSNTEAALLNQRKKAAVAQDAISSELISKSPDSDAGDAARRVTGLTMDQDDRVIIRGLADRYSSTLFAHTVIPSPNPDSRIVPLDIFPVGLLDNLTIVKAYTPDMPGEFCGGFLIVNPKDYPEDLQGKVSVGTGFHLETMGKKFWTHDGGKYDWAGVDDGTRDQPTFLKDLPKQFSIDNSAIPPFVRQAVGIQMQNVYTPKESKGFPKGKIQFSIGNSWRIKDKYNFGFIVSGLFSESPKNIVKDHLRFYGDLALNKSYKIEKSTYSTKKGGLISLGFASDYHKIRATTFYNHQSEKTTQVTVGYKENRQESPSGIDIAKFYDLRYKESDIIFAQLTGEHTIPKINLGFEWTGSYSRATHEEPDVRSVELILPNANPGQGFRMYSSKDLKRFWVEHEDWVVEAQGALTYKFKQWSGIYSTVKAGGGIHIRERSTSKDTYSWDSAGSFSITTNPHEPLEYFFAPAFIVGLNPVDAFHFVLTDQTTFGDDYTGELDIYHGFGMVDIPIIKQLRLVGGYRMEYSDFAVNLLIPALPNPFNSIDRELATDPLEDVNHLGGASLTATPIDDLNIRVAFSKTLARPDFREVVPFQYVQFTQNREVKGNRYLKQSEILNYDFRTEWFPSDTEVLAASFFYKYLDRPIELLENASTTSKDTYSFKNAKYAINYGVEFEFRKDLWFGGKNRKARKILKQFSFMANAAYINSRIRLKYTRDFTAGDIEPLNISAQISELDDLTLYTNKNRPLQGQSPWVVNAGFEYNNEDWGTIVSLMFNMYGRRILAVGIVKNQVLYGDIYEEPWPRLDLTLKQDILKYGQIKLTFSNLIDPVIRTTREQFNPVQLVKVEYDYDRYRLGRAIGVSYSYKF